MCCFLFISNLVLISSFSPRKYKPLHLQLLLYGSRVLLQLDISPSPRVFTASINSVIFFWIVSYCSKASSIFFSSSILWIFLLIYQNLHHYNFSLNSFAFASSLTNIWDILALLWASDILIISFSFFICYSYILKHIFCNLFRYQLHFMFS